LYVDKNGYDQQECGIFDEKMACKTIEYVIKKTYKLKEINVEVNDGLFEESTISIYLRNISLIGHHVGKTVVKLKSHEKNNYLFQVMDGFLKICFISIINENSNDNIFKVQEKEGFVVLENVLITQYKDIVTNSSLVHLDSTEGSFELWHSVVSSHMFEKGHIIFCECGETVLIVNCTFTNISTGSNGSVLYSFAPDNIIKDC
jgi:hypothetical protein